MKRLGLAIVAAGLVAAADVSYAQAPPNSSGTLMVPNSGGGAATSITAGSTLCSGCNANGLLDASGNPLVVNSLMTANSGVLVTSSGGVPSISTTLPSGLTIPSPTVPGVLALGDTVSSSSGILSINSIAFLSAYPGTASNNVFLGMAGNLTSVTGTNDLGIGSLALSGLTTGNDNVAIGAIALNHNLTGSANVAIGSQALTTMTSGDNNTAVGESTLLSANGASHNTAIGLQAGYSITSGVQNICIGVNACRSLTTGNYNTIIITDTGGGSFVAAGTSNAIILGDGQANIRADYNLTTASTWTFAGPIVTAGDVKAATYHVGATAGASCTLTVVAHLTVVNGLVTLCN